MSPINRRQFFGFLATLAAGAVMGSDFAENTPKKALFSANASDYRAANKRIHFGEMTFAGEVLPFSVQRQTPPALLTGPAIVRSGRLSGVTRFEIRDYSEGFKPL